MDAVATQRLSLPYESVADDTWDSWCEHRVIAEQIEMLSDKDLCASGQNGLNLIYIKYIPAKRDTRPFIHISHTCLTVTCEV